MNKSRRFIAGAVCPRCAEMDKLVVYQNENQQQIRECVRCGYQDIMTDDGPQEVTTRVNQPRAGEKPLVHEDEVSVITIIDPNPGAKRRDH